MRPTFVTECVNWTPGALRACGAPAEPGYDRCTNHALSHPPVPADPCATCGTPLWAVGKQTDATERYADQHGITYDLGSMHSHRPHHPS